MTPENPWRMSGYTPCDLRRGVGWSEWVMKDSLRQSARVEHG